MLAGIAEDIGRQLLTYHRRLSKPELFARIDAVTPATIKRVAERFIYDQDLAIAAIGDVQNPRLHMVPPTHILAAVLGLGWDGGFARVRDAAGTANGAHSA